MKKSPQKTSSSSHYIWYKFGRLQTIIEKGVEVLSESQNMVVWHILSCTLRQTLCSPKPPQFPNTNNSYSSLLFPVLSCSVSFRKAQQRGTQPLWLVNPLSHYMDIFREKAVEFKMDWTQFSPEIELHSAKDWQGAGCQELSGTSSNISSFSVTLNFSCSGRCFGKSVTLR